MNQARSVNNVLKSYKHMAKRSKTSGRWLQEHFDDVYVQQAQAQGLRSRAAFKLQEINEQDKLLKPGMTVVDLGAAPGGWSQYAARVLDGKGRVIATDILEMDAMADVEILTGDFREDAVLQSLMDLIGSQPADLVMSDMAPNMSGMKAVDQPKAMYLCELAEALADDILRPGGNFLIKVFQGEGFDMYLKNLRQKYQKVVTRKPKSSRDRSPEVYLLAKGYNG